MRTSAPRLWSRLLNASSKDLLSGAAPLSMYSKDEKLYCDTAGVHFTWVSRLNSLLSYVLTGMMKQNETDRWHYAGMRDAIFLYRLAERKRLEFRQDHYWDPAVDLGHNDLDSPYDPVEQHDLSYISVTQATLTKDMIKWHGTNGLRIRCTEWRPSTRTGSYGRYHVAVSNLRNI